MVERLFGSSPLFCEEKDLLEVLRRLEKIDKRQVNTHTHIYINRDSVINNAESSDVVLCTGAIADIM